MPLRGSGSDGGRTHRADGAARSCGRTQATASARLGGLETRGALSGGGGHPRVSPVGARGRDDDWRPFSGCLTCTCGHGHSGSGLSHEREQSGRACGVGEDGGFVAGRGEGGEVCGCSLAERGVESVGSN